jgi:NADPH-dependent 2,4-dienoyl-CoA reductase/sulfur reductase-like enzyme
VTIAGGNWVGCVIASILLDAGRKVDLVEPRAELAYDFSMQPAMPMMELLSTHPSVTVHLGTTLESIDEDAMTVWSAAADARRTLAAGQVIVVPTLEKDPRLRDELAALGGGAEIHALGDCVSPRKLQDAILDAAVLARGI